MALEPKFRWEVDIVTGERKQVWLTEAELEDRVRRKQENAAQRAVEAAAEAKRLNRLALLDQLAAKIEADPTILERII